MSLNKFQLVTYLQLKGLGKTTAFKLSEYASINSTSLSSLSELLDFFNLCKEQKLVRGMKEYSMSDFEKAEMVANRIYERSLAEEISILSYYDDGYPDQLRRITKNGKSDSPLILYCKGNSEKLSCPYGVAIIGTREPTKEGMQAGEYFGESFANMGFNVISGLAIGCDSSAHRGAIKNGGLTTAFLAHGLDTVYPKENCLLAQQILNNGGLLISEYAIGTKLRPEFLVERDRLQSGLANATVVIQTGLRGGTMHAVNSTIENHKPLFAVQYKDVELHLKEKVLGNMKLINDNIAQPLTAITINEAVDTIRRSIIKRGNFSDKLF